MKKNYITFLIGLLLSTYAFAGGIGIGNGGYPDGVPIDPFDPSEPLGGGPRDPYHPYGPDDPRNPFRNPNPKPKGPFVYDPWPNRHVGWKLKPLECDCNTAGKKLPKSKFRRVVGGIARGAGVFLIGYFWYTDFEEYYDDDQGVIVSGTMATFSTAISCHPIGAIIVWGNPYVSKREHEQRLRDHEYYSNPDAFFRIYYPEDPPIEDHNLFYLHYQEDPPIDESQPPLPPIPPWEPPVGGPFKGWQPSR